LIKIRIETDRDIPAIYVVNLEAFGQASEAILIDRLRAKNVITLSLVAEEKKKLSDIFFSAPFMYILARIFMREVALDQWQC
jgi:predicted N-acetyltransferase YhbS